VVPDSPTDEHPNQRRARFEALVRDELADPLRRYLGRRTSPDTADEVIAGTLLECWRRFEEVPDPPQPWAYGVARRLLGRLGDDAEVLRLSAWEGLDPPAIATSLGVTPEEASERLQRARSRLGDARLGEADPAAALAPADPQRVSRLVEQAMGHDTPTESRRTGTRGRSRLTWLVATAVVAVILMMAALSLTQGRGSGQMPTVEREPSVVEVSMPAQAGAQRCMRPTAEALGTAELAFEGTVADVTGRTVTLVPTRMHAGGPADNVRVRQSSPSQDRLLLGAEFHEGGRYLVAVEGGEVMVCGFSGAYDGRLAALYAQAFDRPE